MKKVYLVCTSKTKTREQFKKQFNIILKIDEKLNDSVINNPKIDLE